MANLEVSSVIAEISTSNTGEVEISSAIIEIASIIPDGEAAIASCAMEIAFSFEDLTIAALQSEIVKRQAFIQSHSLRNGSGLKSNII